MSYIPLWLKTCYHTISHCSASEKEWLPTITSRSSLGFDVPSMNWQNDPWPTDYNHWGSVKDKKLPLPFPSRKARSAAQSDLSYLPGLCATNSASPTKSIHLWPESEDVKPHDPHPPMVPCVHRHREGTVLHSSESAHISWEFMWKQCTKRETKTNTPKLGIIISFNDPIAQQLNTPKYHQLLCSILGHLFVQGFDPQSQINGAPKKTVDLKMVWFFRVNRTLRSRGRRSLTPTPPLPVVKTLKTKTLKRHGYSWYTWTMYNQFQ